ncbi:MAG TPA: hypothetical protein VI911_11795 [Patescibacteria group bacterium]|nr:hypothetical protein [Patescibacteria group bacterium]
MGKRNCIFTGENSHYKTKVIGRDYISDQDELHNWTNGVPVSEEYEKYKSGFPTDLEMDASECFHMLELSRLRVKYYEIKLRKIQQKLKIEMKHKKAIIVKKYTEKHKIEDKQKKVEQNPEQYIEDVLSESDKLIDSMLKGKE